MKHPCPMRYNELSLPKLRRPRPFDPPLSESQSSPHTLFFVLSLSLSLSVHALSPVLSRVLSLAPSMGEEAVAALRETWVTETGAPRWDTLEALAQSLARSADSGASGAEIKEEGTPGYGEARVKAM